MFVKCSGARSWLDWEAWWRPPVWQGPAGQRRTIPLRRQHPALPTITLGKHSITRLVAGWNPIGGYSYLGPHTDRHMKEYYTADQTVTFLLGLRAGGHQRASVFGRRTRRSTFCDECGNTDRR